MATSLSPATRRLVGMLYLIAGGLLLIAQLLRLGTAAYAWQTGLGAVPANTQLVIDLLLLVGSLLLLRYGWRVRRDGHISDEPGDGAIS